MTNIETIKIFNKVINSPNLNKNIIYKLIDYIMLKNNIKIIKGEVSIYEIRSHIIDNKINNNYLIKINKNQFFNLGINEEFDKIDYVLRTYYDLFEEITNIGIKENIISSIHAVINLDIFETKEIAKLVIKSSEGHIIKSPLNIININLKYELPNLLKVLTEEEKNNLLNIINK